MKLNELRRFVNQKNKIPCTKWLDEKNWLTYEEAMKNAKEKGLGISIVLGPINNEYTLAGIDLDTIRDKNSGEIDTLIKDDIKPFNHKHLSMSGYGIHVLCLIRNDSIVKNSKKNIKSSLNIKRFEDGKAKFPEIEFYTNGKLFALPINIDTNKDDLDDMTDYYVKVYNKYNNIAVKPQEDESRKDFNYILDLIKQGIEDKADIEKMFLESDFFNQKDDFHKKKILERDDYLNRTIDKAFKVYEEQEEKNKNKLDTILKLVEEKEIFIDERDNAYIVVDYENIRIESKDFEKYLIYLCHENKIGINKYLITNAQSYISYKATKDNNKYNLNLRFAGDEKTIYYQLNKKEIVKITPNKYEIIENNYPMFKWFPKSMSEQPQPQKSDITFKDFLLQFNIDSSQHLLFIVYIVSLFIPNIPKPILILIAEKGSGKTTTTNFIKSIVDPALLPTQTFPNDIQSLSQILDHSALICFDNLERIQNWQSNALCRAYSGDGFSKRKLHTDEDDIVFQFKRAIILNGINCPATREDILDRSILINLKRFEKYKTETSITEEWNTLKPQFLDLIFKTIAKALPLYYTTEDKELGRTADWCKWGYCIAEAIKDGLGNKFLEDYKKNVSNQNNEVIENNILVQSIINFMSDKVKWEGLASELFNHLRLIACDYGLDGFPKNASWLTRDMKRFLSVLESRNIKFNSISTNKGSKLQLTKTK